MSFKQALKDFFDPKKKIKVPGMSENFYPTEDCDGCGICAKKCPTGHIKMVDGRPDWGKPCLMCAQCGDVCPKNAIAFGSGTEKRPLSHSRKGGVSGSFHSGD